MKKNQQTMMLIIIVMGMYALCAIFLRGWPLIFAAIVGGLIMIGGALLIRQKANAAADNTHDSTVKGGGENG